MFKSHYSEYRFSFRIKENTKKQYELVIFDADGIELHQSMVKFRFIRSFKNDDIIANEESNNRVWSDHRRLCISEVNIAFSKWMHRETGRPCRANRIKNQIPALWDALRYLDEGYDNPIDYLEIENATSAQLMDMYLRGMTMHRFDGTDIIDLTNKLYRL